MEIGNEISQKIRSAIKAKLVELGAYVDEELPDYIMVMVANKKSQSQMSEDLNLFLGMNTDKFTSWLHGLLAKLQSLTSVSTVDKSALPKAGKQKSDQPVDASSSSTSGKSCTKDGDDIDMQKGRKQSSTSDDKPELKKDTKKRKSVDERKSIEKVKQDDSQNTESSAVLEKAEEPNMRPEIIKDEPPLQSLSAGEKTDTFSQAKSETIQIGLDEDYSELILTETDELAEELEQEAGINLLNKKDDEKQVLSQASENGGTLKAKVPTVTVAPAGSNRESTPQSPSSLQARPKAVTSPIRQTTSRQVATKVVAPHISELFTRRKRAPISVVGSVSHNAEEEDEAYDPYNPAVGSVASIVKVTARKSSVPVNLQANKSLLLRAINEAEKSVESLRRVAVTPVKPIIRSEEKQKEEERQVKRQSHVISKVSKVSQPNPRLAQKSLRQAIDQPKPSHQTEYPVYIPTRKVHPSLKINVGERVGLISKSRREEAAKQALATDENNLVRTLAPTKRKLPTSFIITRKREVEPVLSRKKQPSLPPEKVTKHAKLDEAVIDSRVVEYEPDEAVSLQEEEKSVVSASSTEATSQGIPEILDDVENDEFILDQEDMDLAENESSTLLEEEDMRDVNVKEKQKDKTRFVVTLDGVDNEQYEKTMEIQTEPQKRSLLEADEEMVPMSQVKDAAPTRISPPKIQPFSINLKDSDEEGEVMQDDEETTPLKKVKMTERCKFWPACVNGAACEYHHPTVHCKTFPQCRFGDKCLYIHPNCRFDSKCVRPDCPFTHSSRRSFVTQIIPRPSVPIMIPVPPPRSANPPQCKFFPSCSNMNCPFFHPKPCRFGMSCKNRELSCPFFHPPLPTKDKLKWSAEKEKSVS